MGAASASEHRKLIAIADPAFREGLSRYAFERLGLQV